MGRAVRNDDAAVRDDPVKLAVTGATGFIGRHVVAELERNSISPVLICRPSAELPAALAKHSLVRMELRDVPEDAFELIGRPDVLLHLAWGGLPNYKSLRHFEEELPAQYRFLKVLVEAGLRGLTVTGTCAEYGMQSGPLDEDTEARPYNPYGFAKHTLRRQLEYLRQDTPFNLTWARLFYLYGEGQPESSLLPQLKKAVTRGDCVFDMSGGEQLRDYLPVTEAAKHIVSLAVTARDNGVVNVCSGSPVSVRNLAEQWVEEYGWKINLNFGRYPYPDYEPMAFWGNRQKLDRCLHAQ
jgi:dTDP-6-deoxy-L-talose 4-dehydrogenase (NAD+)